MEMSCFERVSGTQNVRSGTTPRPQAGLASEVISVLCRGRLNYIQVGAHIFLHQSGGGSEIPIYIPY